MPSAQSQHEVFTYISIIMICICVFSVFRLSVLCARAQFSLCYSYSKSIPKGCQKLSKWRRKAFQKRFAGLFKKVFESADWTIYREKKSLMGDFLTGTELLDYWQKERDIHRGILKKMGAI